MSFFSSQVQISEEFLLYSHVNESYKLVTQQHDISCLPLNAVVTYVRGQSSVVALNVLNPIYVLMSTFATSHIALGLAFMSGKYS